MALIHGALIQGALKHRAPKLGGSASMLTQVALGKASTRTEGMRYLVERGGWH